MERHFQLEKGGYLVEGGVGMGEGRSHVWGVAYSCSVENPVEMGINLKLKLMQFLV